MGAIGTVGLSRRSLLFAGAAMGGGLLIGVRLDVVSTAGAGTDVFAPNAFIRIPREGKIVLTMPYVEMGQGIYTATAMLIAEELEVSLDQIALEAAPPDESRYAHPLYHVQITGGSGSIRGGWMSMRHAGAAARMMLIAAASENWRIPVTECRAEAGGVVHNGSGRRVAYGTLVDVAASIPVPADVPLKNPKDFRLVGTSARRLDTSDKVTGRAVFGIDARPPGVKIAAVLQCPVFGGTVRSVDDAAARRIKGVRQVVALDDAVAVVADHTGAARKGLGALRVQWEAGENASLTTVSLVGSMEQALAGDALVARTKGHVDDAEAMNPIVLDAVYYMPMLAHAAMEPMNCTVHVTSDACEIWVGTQVPTRAQKAAADVLNLPIDKVTLHNHLVGGGFGRRLDFDGITLATRIARHVDGPVKVIWSREEDIRHDAFRYHNLSHLRVSVGANGRPVSWRRRVAGPSILARFLPAFFRNGIDGDITNNAESPYDIPNTQVEFVRHEAPAGILTGNWRGVGATRNGPPVEGGIDELAHLSGQDPVAYRRALLGHAPRLLGVLDVVAEKSSWGQPLPARSGRGVAVLAANGSFIAQVAEVSVDDDGQVRVDRVVCAIDCGMVVNPDTVKQQIEGGIIFGLSAALYGRINVKDGAVVESNFDTYRVLRMQEAPRIDVHIIPSVESPGGAGEPGTANIAPAILNAVFAATGTRLRSLPIDTNRLRRT